ncbi:MAG: DsbC family protein, partial [Deltaproteobacteria bacterium]|nr:DsbC family protein [Deltaproteobacteria bacterium]
MFKKINIRLTIITAMSFCLLVFAGGCTPEESKTGSEDTREALEGSLHVAGCAGDCKDCHKITKEEAAALMKADTIGVTITKVEESNIKGFWSVKFSKPGQPGEGTIYLDFSKKYLLEGKLIPLDKIGVQPERQKTDVSKISLEDALLVGDKNAKYKVIVFDDPECPYCKKFHDVLVEVVKERSDVAFYLIMFPLDSHPTAFDKAKTIVCEKSVKLLEDAYVHKAIPAPTCETDAIEKNIALARSLGISGTPAIIFPDGTIIPGFVQKPQFYQLLS